MVKQQKGRQKSSGKKNTGSRKKHTYFPDKAAGGKKLSESELSGIVNRYLAGETYKQLMGSGITRRQIINAMDWAEKKYNISSHHLNIRKLVAAAHRNKGIVNNKDIVKYTDWKFPQSDKYQLRAYSPEDLEEFYAQEYIQELIDTGEYTPVVLVAV